MLLGSAPLAALAFDAVAPDRRKDAGGLLAPHDGDARVRPHKEKSRRIGAPAHTVIAGPVTAAGDDGKFWHGSGGHGGDHLGAVLGDPAGFVFRADHEAGDVLQEDQRDAALVGQLDEVGGFLGAFGEENAVIRKDGDRHAVKARETADEGFAVELLELVELRAVNETGDDFAGIIGLAHVPRHQAVQFGRIVEGGLRLGQLEWLGLRLVQRTDDRADDGERVRVVGSVVVGDAGAAGVDIGAAEVFG